MVNSSQTNLSEIKRPSIIKKFLYRIYIDDNNAKLFNHGMDIELSISFRNQQNNKIKINRYFHCYYHMFTCRIKIVDEC